MRYAVYLGLILLAACGKSPLAHDSSTDDKSSTPPDAGDASDPCGRAEGDGLSAYFKARTQPLDPAVLSKLSKYGLDIEKYGIADRTIEINVTKPEELQCLPMGYIAQLTTDLDLGGANVQFKRELNNVILDGNGHEIAHYTVNQNGGGLLATAFNSIFMDIRLRDVKSALVMPFDDHSVVFGGAMGAFAGYISGGCVCGVTADDVTLSTVVDGQPQTVGIGGLVGAINGATPDDTSHVDGIIQGAVVHATLSGKGGGGLASQAEYATIKDSTVTVAFNKDSTLLPGDLSVVGGLVGTADDHNKISGITVNGDLTGGERVGGIAGDTDVGNTFTDVHFKGTVRGTTNVAGLVGLLYAPYNATAPSTIAQSTCEGQVTGVGKIAADATDHYMDGVIKDVDCSKMTLGNGAN